MIKIGIISYLPRGDDKLRQKRINGFKKQLDWLRDIYPNHEVNVVAQGYEDSDISELDSYNLTYFRYDKGIGAGAARNVLLHKFYSSNADYFLIMDDDNCTYPYYESKDFMLEITNNPSKFEDVDLVIPLEPDYYPFKENNWKDIRITTDYKFTKLYLNSGLYIMYLKNIVKLKGQDPLYFSDEVNVESATGREDIDFILKWIKAGNTAYKMNAWIGKGLNNIASVTFFDPDRKEREKFQTELLEKTVALHNIGHKPNGHIDWSSFNKMYNNSKSVLYIPREHKITLGEKEVPPSVKTKQNSLFKVL